MAVSEVEVFEDGAPVSSAITDSATAIELSNVAESFVVNDVTQAAVEVVTPTYLANVVVSPTAPAFPFEGQIWIDVS